MKKYLMGFIVVIVAIGFSAFTGERKQNKDDVYYFYVVDGNGIIPSGSSVQFGGTKTLAYADANDGCSGTANDCMRGFLTQPSLPTSDPGDVRTKKN